MCYAPAVFHLVKPYWILTVGQTHSTKVLVSMADRIRATMDSGPDGDSFLAPRMLPDPDEGGDYRWPPSCTFLP